jgi:hypothetical protein
MGAVSSLVNTSRGRTSRQDSDRSRELGWISLISVGGQKSVWQAHFLRSTLKRENWGAYSRRQAASGQQTLKT